MKEDDLWYTCYERFIQCKKTLPIELNVEFIIERNKELDFPNEVDADLLLKSKMKHTSIQELWKRICDQFSTMFR